MAWVNTTTMMGRCSVTRILFVLMALVLSGCKSGTAVVTGIPTDLPTATSTEAVTVSATTESSASTATGARPNWVVYTNPDYGFSFRYPVTWETMEGRNYIGLSQGTFNLVIGYRHTAEDVNICCRRELPEGRLSSAGTVMCIGQEVTKALLECEGKIKAVDYESTSGIPARDVVFTIYLEDFNADYDAAAIPEGVQSEVDLIVASLETFEPAADLGTPTPRLTRLPPTPVPATATPGPAAGDRHPWGKRTRRARHRL
jgi:hypothetical protein